MDCEVPDTCADFRGTFFREGVRSDNSWLAEEKCSNSYPTSGTMKSDLTPGDLGAILFDALMASRLSNEAYF